MTTLERIEKRLADDVIVKMWNLSGDSFDVPRANWLPHVLSILREELARDERKWISVEERLPEFAHPVWITGNMAAAIEGYLVNPDYIGRVLWGYDKGGTCTGATHWCPRIVDTPPPFPTNPNGDTDEN